MCFRTIMISTLFVSHAYALPDNTNMVPCLCARSNAALPTNGAGLEWNQILSTLPYAPIALFAENLRVQNAFISSILRTTCVPPPITGCIRDLGRVWNLDEFDLYGDFRSGTHFVAVSLRHGNTFPLVNKQVLELAGILNRSTQVKAIISTEVPLRRPTIVNVSFVLPACTKEDQRRRYIYLWACRSSVAIETLMIIALMAICAFYKLNVSVLLIACVASNAVALKFIQSKAKPVYGNASAQHMDSQRKVLGGAALDVHLITSHWNSNKLDVVCGYSSQLHALTNIPIRTNNFRLVSWTARFLVVTLVVQAAALASLIGNNSVQSLGSVVWMVLYLIMQIPERVLHKLNLVPNVLREQPGEIWKLPPIQFSGRRAALAFIATLPVSQKADTWAWLDAFMPSNARRRQWQERAEACQKSLECPLDDKTTHPEAIDDEMILEVRQISCSSDILQPLSSFRQAVGLDAI